MARGRPTKRARAARNITGLRNQGRYSSGFSELTSQPTPPQSQAPIPDGDESGLEEEDEDLALLIHFDSLKTNLAHEEAFPDDGEELEDELEEWEGFGKEDLAEAMVDMFEADDPLDLDWLPEKLKNKRDKRKKQKKGKYSLSFSHISLLIMQSERPKTYTKGPDVMSKSERTRRRHAQAMHGQGRLTGFGFKAPSYPVRVVGMKQRASMSIVEDPLIVQPPSPGPIEMVPELLPSPSRVRLSSMLSDPSTDNDVAAGPELVESRKVEASDEDMNENDIEDWEGELEECLQGPKGHVHDWSDLRKQIKDSLKKRMQTLPLSQVNQLLILSNFATLHLKGASQTQASLEIARQWHEQQGNWFARRVRALARHYQIFERLPVEKHGGSANS